MDSLENLMSKVKKAQEKYSTFSQEAVDKIFYKAASAANQNRVSLAKMAVEETKMGIIEDKVIKNHFAAEFVYNKYRDVKTCGIFEHDRSNGIIKSYEPLGIIIAIIPMTNPTSTIIFKALLALKTRNAVIFSAHPKAIKSSIETMKIILDAAIEAGAPENIIGWIETPSIELTNTLMRHPDSAIILATGGPQMVKAAYSSGIPAIGVGPGNVPVVIDGSADIKTSVVSILTSKTFDNGTVCASEQALIVDSTIYDQIKQEFKDQKAYFLNEKEKDLLRKIIVKNNKLNSEIVGQYPYKIAKLAGFEVDEDTKVLIAEIEKIGEDEPFSIEKLSPILAMYKTNTFEEAIEKAKLLLELGGLGHTSILHINEDLEPKILEFSSKMKTARVLVNVPGAQGAIGDVYNFKLEPSLTLGCGSWGKNSISENISIKHLLNIKTTALRRENMLWFQVPEKIYFKYGCISEAIKELKEHKKAFIITDDIIRNFDFFNKLTDNLKKYDISYSIFSDVPPDPDLLVINKGLEQINRFKPDIIFAFGGGSVIDAGKVIWLLYEHPNLDFEDVAMRFMDIRKRVFKFSKLGHLAKFVAIPTTSGTGSEITPFAVIKDSKKNIKYPIADYELTPDMAIIDPQFVLSMPKSLIAQGGIDAITHSLEAIVAITATEYTDGLALESLKILFKYLPISYRLGDKDLEAKEKVHYAATIAGMAFANAFLGLCHAMAHQLGAIFHIPHGFANAILLPHIIKYNSEDTFKKFSIFSQYKYPVSKQKYAMVARFLNLDGKTEDELVDSLINKIKELKKELDIPMNLLQANVNKEQLENKLDALVDNAFDDQCILTNPRYPLMSEIRQIYLKLLK